MTTTMSITMTVIILIMLTWCFNNNHSPKLFEPYTIFFFFPKSVVYYLVRIIMGML